MGTVEEYIPSYRPSCNEGKGDDRHSSAYAVYVSLIVGGLSVAAAKAVVYCVAPSATVKASLIDSVGDIAGYSIMFITERLLRQADEDRFPAGRGRVEPLGILSFAVFTATTFFNLLLRSAERICGGGAEPEDLYPSAFMSVVLVMCTCIAAKLFCAGFCKRIFCRSGSEVAKTLCVDHTLDMFSNCFVLAVFCVCHVWHGQLGSLEPYIDDLCCMALSGYVLVNWASVARSELKVIAGVAANPELKSRIVQVAAHLVEKFPDIDARLGTLRLFHIGTNLMAEVELLVSRGEVMALAMLVQKIEDKLLDKEVERVLVTVRADAMDRERDPLLQVNAMEVH